MVKRKQLKPAEACEGLEFVKLGDLLKNSFLGYDYHKIGTLKDVTSKNDTGYKMITPKFIEQAGGKRVNKGDEYNIKMEPTLGTYLFGSKELKVDDVLFTRNRLRPCARLLTENDLGDGIKVASSALFVLRFKDHITSSYVESVINTSFCGLLLESITRYVSNNSISLENLMKIKIPFTKDKNKLEHLTILFKLDYKPDVVCDILAEMVEVNKELVREIGSEFKDREKRLVAVPVKLLEDHGIKKIELIYDLERAIELNKIILDE